MKRAVAIIFMTEEEPATAMAVASLHDQLESNDTLLILHNGSAGPQFSAKYASLDRVKYLECEENLGVAGGRNVLFAQPECQEADLIFFVDSDAIVPSDYLNKMTEFMASDPDIGVAGPVVLNYKSIRPILAEKRAQSTFEPLDVEYFQFQTSELERLFVGRLDPDILDHAGTNPNWDYAYFSNEDAMQKLFEALGIMGPKRFAIGLKHSEADLKTLNQGNSKIPVTNIAGCCQVFRGSLLQEIGAIYDLYSPYGHEDVDFCLSALKAGKTNYTTNTTFMMHRTDQRHENRAQISANRRKQVNESRVRTILDYRWCSDQFPAISYLRVLKRAFARIARKETGYPGIFQQLTNEMLGLRQAFNQLALEEKEAFGEIVRKGLSRYDNDIGFYGMLDERSAKASGLDDFFNSEQRTNPKNQLKPRRTHPQNNPRFDPQPVLKTYETLENFAGRRGQYPAERKDKITQVQRDLIAGFRNKHQGERCFIIGNGPSLKKTDFHLLRNEITIGVNGIFYMFDDIGFTPTYYVVEDNHVVDDNLERIVALPSRAKFFPGKYQQAIGRASNHYYLPTDWEFYFKSTPNFEKPRFSRELSEVAYVGQTVTYLNLQLAHYMGFSEVYLIGVDFNYQVPASSKIDGFTIVSQENDPNHFHPEYFGKGKKWHFPKLENCEKVYKHAREIYEEDNRFVRDSTIAGKLKVYKKKGFYGLFENPLKLKTPNDPLVSVIQAISGELLSQYRDSTFTIGAAIDAPQVADLRALKDRHDALVAKSAAETDVNERETSALEILSTSELTDRAHQSPTENLITVVPGISPFSEPAAGAATLNPLIASLVDSYETVILHKDLAIAINGAIPAIISSEFGLDLDSRNIEHINPIMAIAIADRPVTKTRTLSTEIYSVAENVFAHANQPPSPEGDYSLASALMELNKIIALKNNKLFFVG